jgi:hypothetical protein
MRISSHKTLADAVRALTLLLGLVFFLGVVREVLVALLPAETLSFLKYLRHFSFNEEHSLPTWYSAILLYTAALLSWEAAAADRSLSSYWKGLAATFVLLSIDEDVSFHEAFITLLSFLRAYSDYLYFSWVALGAVFVLVFLMIYLPFLRRLPRPTAGRIFLAGAVYVTGALILEVIDGKILLLYGENSLPYIIGYLFEDLLEMTGILIYLHAVLAHLPPPAQCPPDAARPLPPRAS